MPETGAALIGQPLLHEPISIGQLIMAIGLEIWPGDFFPLIVCQTCPIVVRMVKKYGALILMFTCFHKWRQSNFHSLSNVPIKFPISTKPSFTIYTN